MLRSETLYLPTTDKTKGSMYGCGIKLSMDHTSPCLVVLTQSTGMLSTRPASAVHWFIRGHAMCNPVCDNAPKKSQAICHKSSKELILYSVLHWEGVFHVFLNVLVDLYLSAVLAGQAGSMPTSEVFNLPQCKQTGHGTNLWQLIYVMNAQPILLLLA